MVNRTEFIAVINKMARNNRISLKIPGKPVVVEYRLFSHMIDAAYWLARNRPDLWQGMDAARKQDPHRLINNLMNLVQRRCDAQKYGYGKAEKGWWYAENGEPRKWKNPPGKRYTLIEDLRRK